MAEGEELAANSLGGEKRSPWYDCGNCRLGAFTQDCAPARRAAVCDYKKMDALRLGHRLL